MTEYVLQVANSHYLNMRHIITKNSLIANFPEGNFRDLLCHHLGASDQRRLELRMPDYISRDYEIFYFKGLKLYLDLCQNFSVNFDILTAEDIFALAVAAFVWEDTAPLQRLLSQISIVSDEYYWIYLSEMSELFFSMMEVELYRRRISTSLNLYGLSENNKLLRRSIDLSHVEKLNDPAANEAPDSSIFWHPIKTLQILELNPSDALYQNLSRKNSEFLAEILRRHFVIVGPFVDRCIMLQYRLVKLNRWQISRIFELDSDPNPGKFSNFFSMFNECDIPTTDQSLALAQYIGVLALKLGSLKPKDSADKTAFLLKTQNYDVEANTSQFDRWVHVEDNNIYLKVRKPHRGVTIYSTEKSESIDTIVDYLKSLDYSVKFAPDVSCISFAVESLNFSFIKLKYANIRDILASLDLDCDRVALYLNTKDQLKFVSTQSYINAAEHKICVANPYNDSIYYFQELISASHDRGYSSYVPPGIMSRLPTLSKIQELAYAREEYSLTNFSIIRTNITTNGAFDPVRGDYVTQKQMIGGMLSLIDEVESYYDGKLPRDFDILYPLIKIFSRAVWIDVESQAQVVSIYSEYHRKEFLLSSVYYLIYQHSLGYNHRGRAAPPPEPKLASPLEARRQYDADKLVRLNLLKEVLPSDIAKLILTFQQEDLIMLDNLTVTASNAIEELFERVVEEYGKGNENTSDMSDLVLGSWIFDSRI